MAITQGVQYDARIPLFGVNDTALDLSGTTVTVSAKDENDVVLFTHFIELDAGGSVVDSENMTLESIAEDGVVLQSIPGAETALYATGYYVLTVAVELADGSDYIPSTSILQVKAATPLSITRHGVDRRTIRRTVARMLSDYYEATDATGGKTSEFTDKVRLARESNHFKGMQILFSNPVSPHYGTIATVTVSQGPTRTLTFEPPLATNTIPGETIELYNFRGRGTTISQYNGAINDAIAMARQQHHLIPYTVELDDPYSRTDMSIAIPDEFVSFTGMETTERDGSLYSIPVRGWNVDRFSRTVRMHDVGIRNRLNGLTLTMRGYVMPELLEDDDDVTAIDLEWLYNEVKAALLERMVASGMPIQTADRLYLQEREMAAGKRTMIVNRVAPNTVRLT